MVQPHFPITRLIPQRPPFIMVDDVVDFDPILAVTQLEVRPDNLFVDDMQFSPAGIIENMAQSCAARMGYANRLRNEPIRIGYIGDIRDCQILRLPHCHETLHTHVEIVEELFGLTLAIVTVRIAEETIATARMKIAMTDIIVPDEELS